MSSKIILVTLTQSFQGLNITAKRNVNLIAHIVEGPPYNLSPSLLHCLTPCNSKCGSWANSMGVTWELVRNVDSQAPPATYISHNLQVICINIIVWKVLIQLSWPIAMAQVMELHQSWLSPDCVSGGPQRSWQISFSSSPRTQILQISNCLWNNVLK